MESVDRTAVAMLVTGSVDQNQCPKKTTKQAQLKYLLSNHKVRVDNLNNTCYSSTTESIE